VNDRPALADPPVTITPVVSGLAAPRGIAFDGQGSMYVAESGVAGAGSAGMTHSGKVDKFPWGSSTPAWTTSFNSLYLSEDPSQPPDVLGPEGISAFGKGCMRNSHGQRNGCQVQMITSESTPGVLAESDGQINDPQAGHLYRLDGATGAPTSKSDVGSQMYQWTGDHSDLFPDDFPDSNPYGVLVTKGAGGGHRTFVADAGANTISEIMRDGTARVVAYIPNEDFGAFRDSTPTCIAEGPDGYLYVGTLDFVSNLFVPPGLGGFSSVWRVDPNADFPTEPTLWATGLTTITACTADRQGNFWAAEMFAGGLGATPPGDIVRIPFSDPTSQDHFGAGQLAVPGGIAQGPDGAMYVTVGSSAPGAGGGVMRVAVGH
jgi:glucose/arabinose dehydrogenase